MHYLVHQHLEQRLHFVVRFGQDARQGGVVADHAIDAARGAGGPHGDGGRAFIEGRSDRRQVIGQQQGVAQRFGRNRAQAFP